MKQRVERRTSRIQIGRRKSDIPVVVLEQFKTEMKEHVSETITRVVNGNIRDLDTKITNYIKEDTAWKESMEPLREAFQGSKWMVKALVSLMKFAALAAPLGGLYYWLKNHLP